MRIAMLSWEALHAVPVGGVSVHVDALARALTTRGHEVHLFTRQGAGQRLHDNVMGVRYHRCPHAAGADFAGEVYRFNGSLGHYLEQIALQAGPFDVVHAHDWLTMPAAERFCEGARAFFAATFHSTEWGRSGAWPETGESARIADIERETTRRARAIVAVSYDVRRQLDQLYRLADWKTAVIYHGVDLRPFDAEGFDAAAVKRDAGIETTDPTVLFVGRLTHGKGADLLLQAVEAVLARHGRTRFLFVGEGDLGGHLRKEADRFGVAAAVRWLGWREGRGLVALLRAADIVCAPYRKDPYGMVTLAAWAARKPVVATDCGAAGEFAYDRTNALLVRPEPARIAEAIDQLVSDFALCRWMGQNGRVAVETAFAWETIARQTLAAYGRPRQLTAERKPVD